MKPIAKLFALAVVLLSFMTPCRNASAQEKQEFVRKDEIFFLQEEVKQLKTKLFTQESLLEKALADKESLRVSWAIAQAQGEVLQGRVDKLQKDLLDKERAALSDAAAAIASVQAEAKRFEQELNLNRMVIEKKDERIAELTAAHESLMRKMGALIAEKDRSRAEVVRVSGEMEGLKSGIEARLIDEKKMSQRMFGQEKADLEEKMRVLQADMAAEKAGLQKKLDEALRDADQAQIRVAVLEADLSGRIEGARAPFQEQVKSLQAELKEVRQSGREAEGRLSALQKESARLNKIVHEKSLKVSALEKERDTLSKDFVALQGKRIALEKRIVDVQAKAKADAAPLIQQISSFEEKITQCSAGAGRVKTELEKLRLEAQAGVAALAARSEEYRVLERRMAAAQAGKDLAEKTLAEAQEDLKAVNASLPARIVEAKKPLEEKLNALNVQMEALALQLKDKETAVKKLSSDREETLAQLKDAKDKVQALSMDLDQAKAGLKLAEASVPEKLAAVEQASEARIAEIFENLKKAETEVKAKADVLAARNEENRALERRLATLQTSKVSAEKTLAEVEEDLKAVNASLSVKIAEAKKPLEEKLNVLNAQVESSVLQLKDKEAAVKQMSSERDGALAQLKDAKDKVQALSMDLDQAKAGLKQAEASVPEKLAAVKQAAEARVTEVLENLKIVQAEAQVKAVALAARNEEYRLLEGRLASVQAEKVSAEKMKEKAEDSAQILSASLPVKIAEAKKSLEEKVNALDAQTVSLVALLKDKTAETKALLSDHDMVLAQLKEAEAKIQGLSTDLDQAKAGLKQAEASAPEKLAAVKQAAEVKIAEVKKPLEEKIAVLSIQNKELDASISGKVADTRKLLEEKINALNAQAGSLAAQLKDKDMAEKQISLERDAFASQLKNAEARLQALSTDLDQAKAALKKAEASVPEKLDAVKQAAEARIAEALENLKIAQAEAQVKAVALAARNEEYRLLEGRLASAQAAKLSVEKKRDQAEDDVQVLSASLPVKIAEAVKPLEEKIAALNARNKDLDAAARQLSSGREADVKAKAAELVKLKDQYRALQEDASLKDTALRQKEVACSSLEAHVKDLQKKIAVLQADLDKKEDDLAETEKSGTSLWAEYQELQSQLAIARKALNALRSKKEIKAQGADAETGHVNP
jgi:chromosome segregation ATPase